MRRFRPVHGFALVLAFVALFIFTDYWLEGGFQHSGYQRVMPAADGSVEIDVGDLAAGQVSYYRFLNTGNQEVKFFVGRDAEGTLQVAFDANEICFKRKRGYAHDDEWLVCRVCDTAFRLAEVNDGGGGCKPVPLVHRLEGDRLLLTEAEILRGWRLFR